jgi:hypothetical protein
MMCNMSSITIPKQEYSRLKRHEAAYRRVLAKVFDTALRDPIEDVVQDFTNTKKYSDAFLVDLEKGLRASTYGEHAHRTAKK